MTNAPILVFPHPSDAPDAPDVLGAVAQRLRVPIAVPVSAPRPAVALFGADPAEDASWSDTAWAWWTGALRSIHDTVWQSASTAATGVEVPAESLDPKAAKDYAIVIFRQLAGVNGWPADAVAQRIAAIEALAPSATVNHTLEAVSAFGPPANWPQAERWYALIQIVADTAVLARAGEVAGKIQIAAGYAAKDLREASRTVATWVGERVQQGMNVAEGLSTGAGVGIVGLLTVAALIAGIYFAAPVLLPFLAGRASRGS